MLFSINLITFITQPLYFSKCKSKFTFKLFSFRLNIRPYSKLNKEVTDFTKYSTGLEVLYTTKRFHLTVRINYKYYKET